RVREVVGEAGDPVDFHAGGERELVAGHGRADGHADQVGVDAVLVEGPFEDLAGLFGDAPVGFGFGASSEEGGWRELPGAAPAGAGGVEGHLAAGLLDDRHRRQVGLGGLGGAGLVGGQVTFEVVELGDPGGSGGVVVLGWVADRLIVGGVGVGCVGL